MQAHTLVGAANCIFSSGEFPYTYPFTSVCEDTVLGRRHHYCPNFTDEKTEAQDHTASKPETGFKPQARGLTTRTSSGFSGATIPWRGKDSPLQAREGAGRIRALAVPCSTTTKMPTAFSIAQVRMETSQTALF